MINNLSRNLEIAKDYILNTPVFPTQEQQFSNILYPFTTENLSGYLNENMSNKRILTVGSSGDQALNYILLGSTDITVLDLNIYSKYYFNLKKAAILTLDYDDYLDFFINYDTAFKQNNHKFNKNVFNLIASQLDYEDFQFWNTLFENFSGKDIRDTLFSKDENKRECIIKSNPYLQSNNNYTSLKKIICNANVKFLVGDILQYQKYLTSKFDYINLSNIALYLIFMFQENHLENYKDLIENLSNNHLKENGQINIGYLYEYKDYCDLQNLMIYDLVKVFNIFNNLKLVPFYSINTLRKYWDKNVDEFPKNNFKDGILLYTKTI
ncbi:MAG: DUF3419 family protein [Clostridia bacterium]|nr:DUF3419 family protein [Clostridia bacterium]